jgi:hypothetical protein
MPRFILSADRPVDRVLLAGLLHLRPVIEELADGVLLIGGLATTAWLASSPLELPLRATRDVDLGVDRIALGLTRGTRRIGPLLERHEFERRAGDEPFRFRRSTRAGDFIVDLLLPRGASSARPPLRMRSLEARSGSTCGSASQLVCTDSSCRSLRSMRCW